MDEVNNTQHDSAVLEVLTKLQLLTSILYLCTYAKKVMFTVLFLDETGGTVFLIGFLKKKVKICSSSVLDHLAAWT